jgi:transposase
MARMAGVREVSESRYWREAEARVLVEAWRRSGERVSGFARRHGVEPRRLARWVRRLAGAGEGSVRFHPVRLVERSVEAGAGGPIEIQVAGGRYVRVPRGFESEDLRRVLAVLAEVGRC